MRFVDGSTETVDAIVWCTGYKVAFPFFDEDFLPVRDNYVPLWMHTMSPGVPNLFFVGLYQPLGSIMQPAEVQAKLIAEYLRGEVGLPDEATMRREIERERVAMRRRYVASPRHTMQVDFAPFLHRLRRLRDRGARLARRRGNPACARARRRNRLGADLRDRKWLRARIPATMSWDLRRPSSTSASPCTRRSTATVTSTTRSTSPGSMTAPGRIRPSAASRRRSAGGSERGMAVWRTQINYLRPALEGDHIQVATWPVLNDQRLRIDRRFQIRRREDGETLLRALIHYVCIDLESGRARRMPAEFARYYVPPRSRRRSREETEPSCPGVEPD